MSKRKVIGLIIAHPESIYAQRILDGMFTQCEKYGYNVAVFSPLVQTCNYYREYLNGELNIFELVNFERLDGIVVAPITLTEDRVQYVFDDMLAQINEKCTKPVISLDLPFGEYDTVYTDDSLSFTEITEHILDAHNTENIYFLAGMKDYPISNLRLSGYTKALTQRGITVKEENIFYGDFWYSGGAALADKIVSGEVPKPDAVICASDHMAIGLANRLIEKGFRVPQDIIVTGYDATQEAVINHTTITSYIPRINEMAAEAINKLREVIEPNEKLLPITQADGHLCIGSSCGCKEDMDYIKDRLNASLFNVNIDYGRADIEDYIDIGRLLESYALENYMGADNIHDCLRRIFEHTYLLRPYGEFFLCLNEHWQDTELKLTKGYEDHIKTVIRSKPTSSSDYYKDIFYDNNTKIFFDKEVMLPQLFEESDKPSVFYFAPVHFQELSLGYAVLRNDLSQKKKITIVFRNWLRNVNNALEMIRINNKLKTFSQRDTLTGLYNRRGMEINIRKLSGESDDSDHYLVFVIDMDGLKITNDTYGHSAGDYGITAIASTAQSISRNTEICVRAGGDEFYIIGIGNYSIADAYTRIQKFYQELDEINKLSGKPFEISASIGFACEPVHSGLTLDEIINLADSRMYQNKINRKKNRT